MVFVLASYGEAMPVLAFLAFNGGGVEVGACFNLYWRSCGRLSCWIAFSRPYEGGSLPVLAAVRRCCGSRSLFLAFSGADYKGLSLF